MSLIVNQRPLRSHPSAQACALGTPGERGREIAVGGSLQQTPPQPLRTTTLG